MLRLGTIVMGAEDVEAAVAFWAEALGMTPHYFPESENGFTILVPPDGIGTRIALQESETPAEESPRVHLDLIVDSAAEQAAEVERLVGLGGAHVDWASYPPNADFVVLADPAGNRFCIVDASHG